MGATDFQNRIEKKGRDARECFNDLTDQARHEYGHGGYTGTIAEKTSFRMVEVPQGKRPLDHIQDLALDDDAPARFNPFNDKWGPAGCIDDGDAFIFFGMASC